MANYSFDYEVMDSIDKLSDQEQKLFEKAEEQMKNAYAPYSSFFVGAAILLDNGDMVGGSNQENASYSLCMCAERTALYSFSSKYRGPKPVQMAIIANNPNKTIEKPIPPCGACRQVILEYETRFDQDIEIMLKDDHGKYYRFANSRQLLPLAFDKTYLKNNNH